MCGFVGQFKNGGVSLEAVRRANALIKHRGPDDEGYFCDHSVALGFRRLSIIDLTPGGHQPMAGADDATHIVFNGEIYNYVELREELKRLGSTFHTQSDTEVILAAYDHWGLDCFSKMNGMWAIAIWDAKKRQLVLSRDRFGEKPLYVTERNGCLYFGSEIKTIISMLGNTPPPNDRCMFDYLVYAFHDHTEETFFQGITQILPGSVAVATEKGIQTRPFWTLQPSDDPPRTFHEAADHFRSLFTDSVRLRLRSDVPIGMCLSGGLDSSTIVLTAHSLLQRERTTRQLETFTAYADEPKADERKYSRMVNEMVHAHANEVSPSPETFLEDFSSLLKHQEEPFLSMSIFAQWEVMRLAKKRGITVLLDGQGGDEILAGYIPFFASLLAGSLRRGSVVNFAKETYAFLRHHRASTFDILPTFALYFFPRAIGKQLMRRSGQQPLSSLDSTFRARNFQFPDLPTPFPSALKNHLYRLLRGPGIRALLHYEDRNAMAFSIESRVPFLDHRLAEFTLGLPDEYLLSEGETKRLLRSAFRSVLPTAISQRKDKMGFVVPQVQWMTGYLREEILTRIQKPSAELQRYVSRKALQEYPKRFFAGEHSLYPLIWRWYNIQAWIDVMYG